MKGKIISKEIGSQEYVAKLKRGDEGEGGWDRDDVHWVAFVGGEV